jgi:peptide/nickel transport system substrate-binding protein
MAVPILAVILLAACASPPGGQRGGSESTQPAARGAPKRLVSVIMAEPASLHRALFRGGVTQAQDISDFFVNSGLTALDSQGVRQPILAEAAPSIDNGLWKLLPDGRMELLWKIRGNAAWHDGTPLTTDDLLFTLTVAQDKELPEFRNGTFDVLQQAEALDSRTLRTVWEQPFIRADRLFTGGRDGAYEPIPRHLLERTYLDNKDGFRQLAYWTNEYVGLGPYKLKEWSQGSYLLLEANDAFVLGRPKIDEMEVRIILDPGTVGANILAGAVQATVGTGLNLEQSLEIHDQWRDGKLEVSYENWILAYPQFINPNPPIVLNPEFRRALLRAIDRQAMADVIQAGYVPIAHSYVRPDEPEYKATEPFVVKYEYDPRRAAQGLEELGYTRGPDGILVDATGQRLSMEVRASTSPEIHTKSFFPVVDYWQRLGIAIDPVVIPIQKTADLEYRTTHPSFEVMRHPNGPSNVERLHSNQAPLPSNRFVGQNRARYMNPEFDSLIEQYLATIPWDPRMQILGQIVHQLSDQLIVMGLFYDLRPTLVGNQVQNMAANNPTWNVHEWDIAR